MRIVRAVWADGDTVRLYVEYGLIDSTAQSVATYQTVWMRRLFWSNSVRLYPKTPFRMTRPLCPVYILKNIINMFSLIFFLCDASCEIGSLEISGRNINS